MTGFEVTGMAAFTVATEGDAVKKWLKSAPSTRRFARR
jgi:hypothetical protein